MFWTPYYDWIYVVVSLTGLTFITSTIGILLKSEEAVPFACFQNTDFIQYLNNRDLDDET